LEVETVGTCQSCKIFFNNRFIKYKVEKDEIGNRFKDKFLRECFKQQIVHKRDHCKTGDFLLYPCFFPGCGKCFKYCSTRDACSHSKKFQGVKFPAIPDYIKNEAHKKESGEKKRKKSSTEEEKKKKKNKNQNSERKRIKLEKEEQQAMHRKLTNQLLVEETVHSTYKKGVQLYETKEQLEQRKEEFFTPQSYLEAFKEAEANEREVWNNTLLDFPECHIFPTNPTDPLLSPT